MAAVLVSIAGRSYRMSCEDGEEQRLEQLAKYVESKILAMKEGFGEIGEQRIVVMAALAIADEASDARMRAQTLDASVSSLKAELEMARKERALLEEKMAAAIDDTARRLERLNADLTAPAPKDELE